MASHTICCTCGHIIKLANAVAGAKTVCPRCQKIWTVPDLPDAAPSPSPSRRPIVVRKTKSSSSGLIAVVAIVLIGAGIAGVFLLQGSPPQGPNPSPPVAKAPPPPLPDPAPPYRAPRTDPPPPAEIPIAEPPPPPQDLPPRAIMSNKDLQGELDLLIYRINTLGLTARVLECRGKKEEAAKLHETAKQFLADLDKFLKRVEREGHKPHVPDHLLPGDLIKHFERNDFAKLGPAGSERVLVRFLGSLRAGSRAHVEVGRGDDFAEFDIIYHQRPKELFAITQVASIIPGEGVDTKDPAAPEVKPEPPATALPEALKILTDALLRLPAAERKRASEVLRQSVAKAKAPAVIFVAANYLSVTDEAIGLDAAGAEALQAYFTAVKLDEIESFDRPRHLAALGDLKTRIPKVRPVSPAAGELLLRFALAHAADSGASETDVRKAAEGITLRRTADGRRWGDELSVLKADLVAEIQSSRVKDAWRRFDDTYRHHEDFGVRLLGAWLLATETLARNQGGYDRLAAGFRFIGKDESSDRRAHTEALAEGVEAMAKCPKCKSGSITCPKCGGDSKVDIKCQKCDGKGTYEKGGGTVMCRECLGKGEHKDVDCTCGRTSGKVQCPDCKGKMWAPQAAEADLAKVAALKSCAACEGLGLPPVGIALPCPSCFGLGFTLVPAADPKRTLK